MSSTHKTVIMINQDRSVKLSVLHLIKCEMVPFSAFQFYGGEGKLEIDKVLRRNIFKIYKIPEKKFFNLKTFNNNNKKVRPCCKVDWQELEADHTSSVPTKCNSIFNFSRQCHIQIIFRVTKNSYCISGCILETIYSLHRLISNTKRISESIILSTN